MSTTKDGDSTCVQPFVTVQSTLLVRT